MKNSTLRRLSGYLKPYRVSLAFACLFALLQVGFSLSVPVLIGRAIDCIIGVGNVDFSAVLWYLCAIAACAGFAAAFQWGTGICTRRLSALAAQDIRQQAFDALNAVPIGRIDTTPHGDLVSRLVNDADAIAEGLLQGLTQLLPGVCTIVAVLGIMLRLNAGIALVVALVTPVSILWARFVTKRTSDLFRRQATAQGQLSGYVNEMVSNHTIVQSFAYEATCADGFSGINAQLKDASLWAVFYSAIINPGTRFVNNLVYAAVGLFGALSVIGGGLSVGTLSAFLTYANQYTKPFNEVTAVLTQLQMAMASAARLFEVIDYPPEPADAATALTPQACNGKVELRHVSFRYLPETPLIEDFSLTIQPGQRVAIVGPTGCGKTTLINLLMRFYDVTEGEIFVDDVPISTIKRSALRSMYGMVLQESWLKSETVRDNIAYGKPSASMQEVIAAAKAVHAHSFIQRLPHGYDTIIAPGGTNLSTGQKQLLCIARIMLNPPEMLILDEATSNIDTRTEMRVQAAGEKLMQGRTSFVVAHRLSTIQTADVILVMDSGHIVEQGKHDELLAQNGFYATLYKSQFAAPQG